MKPITAEELANIHQIKDVMKQCKKLSKGKDVTRFIEDLLRENQELKEKISKYDTIHR